MLAIWSSVRRKVMGVMLRNAMRGGRPSSDDEDEDAVDEDMAELRRLFNAHFDDDNESDAGSDTAQLETTDTDTNTSQQQGTANNLNKRLHSVGNMFGKRRNSKTSQQQISSTVCNRQNAPKFDFKDPFWSLMRILEARPMELESFLLQNFVMHPLSLIARFSSFSAQLATSNSTSFRIKLLLLNHRQMTGTDPKNKMGKRVALRPILFIDKVGEHLVKSVIMGNSMRLFTIAGAIGLQSAMRSLGYLKRMNESDGPDGINNVNSSGNGDNDDVNENLVSDNQSDTEELMSAVLGDVSESSQFGLVSPRTAQSFQESFRETDGLEIEMDSGSHRRVNISQNQGNSSMPSFKESTKSIQSIPPPSDVVRMSNKS